MANNNLIARLDNENIVVVDEITDHATGENSGVFDETTDTLYPFGVGSDATLPEVTSADNGKVLTVVEGEWNKAEPSTEIFYVDVTEDSTKRICNKTYVEIRTAFFGGKNVIFRYTITNGIRYSILRELLERYENGYWYRRIETDVNPDGFVCESSVSEEDVNSKYPEYYF